MPANAAMHRSNYRPLEPLILGHIGKILDMKMAIHPYLNSDFGIWSQNAGCENVAARPIER